MIVSAYADGGVIGANPSSIGGVWAWCHVDEAGRRIATDSGVTLPRASLPLITNNLTEMIALVRCLEALPAGWSGTVYSDSQVTLGRLFQGWKMNGIPPVLMRQGSAAVERLRTIHWILLDGHPTKAQLAAGIGKRGNLVSEHNVWADAECNRRAREYQAARQPILQD